MTDERRSTLLSRSDAALAAAVTLGTLMVYVTTLAPGLIAITDTPKFQFIGRILGTAHPPGYPLYVMVSHLFGYLPIGSLAYRINLMSAVCSAAAAGLTFVAARLLGVGRIPALAAALAFAFGSAVWYASTIAEVYALNAFLVSAVVVCLFSWGRTSRAEWFYAAVAVVGIGLGNHTTMVFMIPATAACACLAAPRFALRPRTIAISAAIVAVALTQYVFIIIRNQQGAWGEAPAWNLVDLARVVTGSQYYSDVMPNGLRGFLATIGPGVGAMFIREMSLAALAVAALGIVILWQRSRSALALLLVAMLAYAGFAAAYTPKEFEVFLIPAFIMAWLLAAVGADWLVWTIRQHTSPALAGALAAGLFVVPAWQIARNHAARDMSHARADMRFFDALFDRLADRTAIVHEDFLVDRMVYYKMLGEDAARGKDLRALVDAGLGPVGQAWRDQYNVLAFTNAARMMRLLDGAEFSYTPLDLGSGAIERYLDDLPRGAVVAVGVPASLVPAFARDRRMPLESIGFSRRLTALDASGGLALVGERGGRAVEAPQDPGGVQIVSTAPPASGEAPGESIAVHADRDAASIEFGGREILRTTRGMAVAVWTGSGLSATFAVSPMRPPPPPPTPYSIYPLRGIQTPRAIGHDPIDLTGEASGGSLVFKTDTGAARLVIYAGRNRPLAPALRETSARSWPTLEVREVSGASGPKGDLARMLEEDGVPFDERLQKLPFTYRIAVDTSWSTAASVQIGFGGVPAAVLGRLLYGAPGHIYSHDLLTHLTRIDDRTQSLHMARDHHAHLVGPGWSDVLADAVGPYRETVAPEAELLIPVNDPTQLRIGVQLIALGDETSSPKSVRLRFNGEELESIVPAHVWRRFWWSVPAATVTRGVNSLVLTVEPTTARIAVSDVLVEADR